MKTKETIIDGYQSTFALNSIIKGAIYLAMEEYANQFKTERDSLKEQNERLLQNTESQKQTFDALMKKYESKSEQADKLAEALGNLNKEVNCVLSHSNVSEQEDKYEFMINAYKKSIEALSTYKQSKTT